MAAVIPVNYLWSHMEDSIIEKKELALPKKQRFDYLVILDFEATCERDIRIKPQEIIEWPAMVIDTRTMQIIPEMTFHRYIKPVKHPNLTDFCTQLTGITQSMVHSQPLILEVLKEWNSWVNDTAQLNEHTACVVTCGDWDLRSMWVHQRKQLDPIPASLKSKADRGKVLRPKALLFDRWINIKKSYMDWMKQRGIHHPESAYGMMSMLRALNIPHKGRHHSGIDDVRNIAEIALFLLRDGYQFDVTTEQRQK